MDKEKDREGALEHETDWRRAIMDQGMKEAIQVARYGSDLVHGMREDDVAEFQHQVAVPKVSRCPRVLKGKPNQRNQLLE